METKMFSRESLNDICFGELHEVMKLAADNAIYRKNHYPVDKYWQNQVHYPPESDLSMQWIVLSTL